MSSRQTENTLIHSFEESFTSPVMENATGDTIEGAMDLANEYAIDVNDVEDNSNDEGNNPNGGENNPNDNEDPHDINEDPNAKNDCISTYVGLHCHWGCSLHRWDYSPRH
ncbi:hypothetical protein U1Q18_013037 [Sarracenia purpurea var. burkii]